MLERLTALSEGCAAVLLAGDLFDSARVYRDTLEAPPCCAGGLPLPRFYRAGNHDALLARLAVPGKRLAGKCPYLPHGGAGARQPAGI